MAAVVLLGATVLGAPPRTPGWLSGVVLLISGVVLFVLEYWKTSDHVRQLAGASSIAKLALIAWMVLDPRRAEFFFWLIVLWSVIFAHAPASFRHRHLVDFGRK